MLSKSSHKVIIAYTLEDRYGHCPFYYDGHKAIIPEGYYFAYLNPSIFRESCYRKYYYKMHMYEYVLFNTALTYDTGEVLFRKEDIISKTIIRR